MTDAAQRTLAVFRKEVRHIARDRLSLGLLVVLPALLLVLYGYALSFDVTHVRTAVLDLDRTPASRELLDGVFRNRYFDRVAEIGSAGEADRFLDEGFVRAVMIVPRGYARGILSGEGGRFQVLIDGADANTAGAVVGYFDAMAARVSEAAAPEAGADAVPVPVVRPQPRVLFNPDLVSARFLIPGLVGMLLMISAVIATSLSIVREKERETIEAMMASPLRPAEFLIGKTLPYVVLCFFTMALILVLGRVFFGVAVQGSLWALAAVTAAFLFAALGMGVLISSVTTSQQVAFQIAIMTSLLPSVVLSGFIFPIKDMPLAVRIVTHLVIPRYFVSALREIILKGAPLGVAWHSAWPLLVLGSIMSALALLNTRKAV